VELAFPAVSLVESLGFGNDGAVWATSLGTALKVYERENNYSRELACYERLFETRTYSIGRFKLPTLIDCESDLLALEMTTVKPPYLLDFGKSYLDQPPDFSAEVLSEWEAERSSWFEPGQWPRVQSALAQLRSIGIYYFDAKPANIAFAEQ